MRIDHTWLLSLQDIEVNVEESGNAELAIDFGEDSDAGGQTEDIGDGVARGKDALTVLDNPQTRFQFTDELEEVCLH